MNPIYNTNNMNPMMVNSLTNVNPIMVNSMQNIGNQMMIQSNPNMANPFAMNLNTNPNNLNNNFINNMNNNVNNMNMMNNNINNNVNNSLNNQNPFFNPNMNPNNACPNNNINNNNSNVNNLNINMNNLNLNDNRKETLYKEKSNYVISDGTKLILNNVSISRGKLIANLKTISPTLQCAICLDLVMTPVECKNCSKLFCKYCIDQWLTNAQECPNKHPFEKKDELDDWIKKELGKVFLKCPFIGCTSDFNYKYWTNHVKICPCKERGVRQIKEDETTENPDEPFIWENIQIFVKDIHGRTHTFELPLSTTVKELKEKLEEKTGFKAADQRLTCNGKPLEDSKMLEYYGIQKNQTILQLARLKGGDLIAK